VKLSRVRNVDRNCIAPWIGYSRNDPWREKPLRASSDCWTDRGLFCNKVGCWIGLLVGKLFLFLVGRVSSWRYCLSRIHDLAMFEVWAPWLWAMGAVVAGSPPDVKQGAGGHAWYLLKVCQE
jgi:hypothetical protein